MTKDLRGTLLQGPEKTRRKGVCVEEKQRKLESGPLDPYSGIGSLGCCKYKRSAGTVEGDPVLKLSKD